MILSDSTAKSVKSVLNIQAKCRRVNHCAAELLSASFSDLKLELLSQFTAPNEWNVLLFTKYKHLQIELFD